MLCYGKNITGSRFIKKMKDVSREMMHLFLLHNCFRRKERDCDEMFSIKMCVMKKKGKCFPLFIKRKILFSAKAPFSLLTGIKFPLTSFPYGCQTLETKENEFQELVFLETNTA